MSELGGDLVLIVLLIQSHIWDLSLGINGTLQHNFQISSQNQFYEYSLLPHFTISSANRMESWKRRNIVSCYSYEVNEMYSFSSGRILQLFQGLVVDGVHPVEQSCCSGAWPGQRCMSHSWSSLRNYFTA